MFHDISEANPWKRQSNSDFESGTFLVSQLADNFSSIIKYSLWNDEINTKNKWNQYYILHIIRHIIEKFDKLQS